jgi:hypothetical protein
MNLPKQIIRQGWRKQFDKALQVEETDSAEQLEWLEIPLATDEDWEW